MEPCLPDLLPSWQLSMTSERKSPATIQTYTNGVNAFLKWCREKDRPAILDKRTVTEWMAEMLNTKTEATTAKARQHALKMFAKWLFNEGEIDENPLEGLKAPRLDSKVVHALSDEQVKAMIRACQGKSFVDRRDEALVRLMAETGVRASETLNLTVKDVDLHARTAIVRSGKGFKGRIVPLSATCATALDRYIRQRRKLTGSDEGMLWIGAYGNTFGYYGLRKSMQGRAKKANIDNFHLHLFRHTFATRWLRHEGSEAGLMAIAGWSNREMVDRYTGASAAERAHAEARKLDLGF